jgi:acyl carrier protein
MSTAELEQATSELSTEDVLAKVQILLRDLLKLETTEEVAPNARLSQDLGLDSLAMVDLIIAFEEGFGLRMQSASSVKLFESVHSVNDVAQLVVELLKENNVRPSC